MPVPKANQRAVNKYVKNNYDRINVTMPKGQKEAVKAHAEAHSESVNGFINRAIQETMERNGGGMPPETAQRGQEGPRENGTVSLPSEAIETAQRAAEAAGEAVPVFLARAVETQAQRDALSRRMEGEKANE